MVDNTHDRALRSWVESANEADSDFPIQNLPLGVFRPTAGDAWRVGVAIGREVLDVAAVAETEAFLEAPSGIASAAQQASLNPLIALGTGVRRTLRALLSRCLRDDTSEGRSTMALAPRLLHASDDVELRLPIEVGDYTDFYASVHHATNIGTMFRPDSPLLSNYKWIPIGYHGRASSLVVSGTPVRRPCGQIKRDDESAPVLAPSARLDYEAELAFVVGADSSLGVPVPIDEAGALIAGVLLLNDWSARDLQGWEYQPLGPFLSKNFSTSLSPWLVTVEALAPFRAPAYRRPTSDPHPLPYLLDQADQHSGAFKIQVEVSIRSATMRARGLQPVRLSSSAAADLYWTPAQFVAHHTSGGCNLRVGDILGSGTISGPSRESRGCMMELTWRGSEPISLPTGETRRFLEDGDEVTIHGWCEREGYRRIGLGVCSGEVLSPVQSA